jgi:chemotaxis protein CheZ
LSKAALERLVTHLKDERRTEPSLKDVVTLAELTAEALQSFYARMDREVYGDLIEIGQYIGRMREEIAALGVDDLKKSRLPAAGQELDEIVRATEEATNTIMGCAETLMAADPADAETFAATVQDSAMRIFEACAFQDITGQRIAKVVEALQSIEARVARFAEAVRLPDGAGAMTEHEAARDARRTALLLNGPQARGVAIDQSGVDSLMADGSSSQADIDSLFR